MFEQDDLTPASRASFLGACTCLCDAGGCGGSTTITTGGSVDTGDATTATGSDSGTSSTSSGGTG